MDIEIEEDLDKNVGMTEPISNFDEASKLIVDGLKLPPWNAFHSVLTNDTATPKETNILHFPLIPGPAFSYSAIYTALKLSQSISTWTCPTVNKTVISLDLDLFERAYLLVQSRDDLRNKFVLRLGEMHIEFAALRAIGRFIENSGLIHHGLMLNGSEILELGKY